MNAEQRNRLEEECLHYLWDCHEAPEEFEARLAFEPELAALLEETRAKADLLTQAASAPAPKLDLRAPTNAPPFAPRFLGRGTLIAASILFALFVLAPCAIWGMHAKQLSDLQSHSLRLVVSAPRGVPDGTPASVHVDTWDLAGGTLAAQIDWEAFDADGKSLASGTQASTGSFDLSIPANLQGLRRVQVRAQHEGRVQEADVLLAPNSEAPLAHLTTDKPIYRPGEPVYVRVVLLDRLSLEPIGGSCRLRITDSKDAPVLTEVARLEDGTGSFVWAIPETARGGEYRVELRDSKDEFAAESLKFIVRRFQAPTLAKRLRLDRESYSPGESGHADLIVERITGGPVRGAEVTGALLVDGDEVWSETRRLDAGGAAQFTFTIPSVVERGEGRFTCRVDDGGVIETALEAFVISTGKLIIDFYPEGGDLVAGLSNRVYAEVTDTLGRPTSARGEIVDRSGRRVAAFETQHQGRARFEFEPEFGMRYSLRLDDHAAEPFVLPESIEQGVVIHSQADIFAAGEPIELAIETTGEGPFVAGLFCRGVLVGQAAFQGRGEHELQFDLREEVAGVLRLTVFDRKLNPLAERLTARASGREITVSVEPEQELLAPGEHQRVSLHARDENGDPVSCVLGVTVTDRAVRDMHGEQRLGLADQTWFFADVEELEDVSEFLAPDSNSQRNVDLLLGTRGWRRFAWFDAKELLGEEGERAKRLLVREGRPQVPLVEDVAGDAPELAMAARRALRSSKRTAGKLGTVGALLLCMLVLWSAVRLLPGLRTRRWQGHLAGFASCAALTALVTAPVMQAPGAMLVADAAVNFEQPAQELVDAGGEIALGEDWRMNARHAGEIRLGLPGAAGPGAGGGPGAGPPGRGFAALQAEFGRPEAARQLGKIGYVDKQLDADEFFLGHGERREQWRVIRVYAHRNARSEETPRSDFTETLYWNPLLRTELDGRVSLEFDLSDRVTTWDVNIDAHGSSRVGQAQGSFRAVPPFHLEAKLPVEVTVGDELLIPIAFNARDGGPREGILVCRPSAGLELDGEGQFVVPLSNGLGRALVPMRVVSSDSNALISLAGQAGDWRDSLRVPLRISPRGFPQRISKSGIAKGRNEFTFGMPNEWVDGSLEVKLTFYPSPLSELIEGMEGLLQEPGGCFEQASRTNYPNVLALTYMDVVGDEVASVSVRSRDLLQSGYDLLTGYECSDLGYEWFGGNPGHEALTAYGLLQFHDMARVFDVDTEMIDRTRQWLMSRRDGQGGYLASTQALDSFGRAQATTTDAYCTYSLVVTGTPPVNLKLELDRMAARAVESEDAYELGLCAAALGQAGREAPAKAARERLKTMQHEDGSLVGFDTITRSGGDDLAVETTSLAVLAWLAGAGDEANVRKALEFIASKRQGHGTFGTTQATILALKALTAYAGSNRREVSRGDIAVFVNDFQIDTIALDAGQVEAIRLTELTEFLSPGANRVRFLTSGGNEIPWSLDVRYSSEQPADAPDAKVSIETEFDRSQVAEGETVSLEVTIRNLTSEGQPMTMAIVGLPAGLEAPTKILDDLKKAGRFDFWELEGRELVLYWRALEPGATKQVNLDLLARIPGTTTGPASRVRLYYTPQNERWAPPLQVEVD